MFDGKGAKTPMEADFQYDNKLLVINVPNRQLIGSLMIYLSTNTRPYIIFVVLYLCKYVDKPTTTSTDSWKKNSMLFESDY